MPDSGSPITPSNDLPATRSGETFLGHPLGLFLLFIVEMWERFSYYGMRALLVLYLTQKTTGDETGFNPGRGWSEADASTLYGWYTGLAYLFPIFGGLIADKFIGTHRSMLVGGTLIALGHIILGVSGIGALAQNAEGMSLFITGLAVIVLGTGHFKPTVSVMVGQLYEQGDPRRDAAFTIFYMGINLGAFLCAFVCGTLGEHRGWHWGFGSAAVGMLAGMGIYLIGRPMLLRDIGEAPRSDANGLSLRFFGLSLVLATLFGLTIHLSGATQPPSQNSTPAASDAAEVNTPADDAAEASTPADAAASKGWDAKSILKLLGAIAIVAAAIVWAVGFVRKNEPEDRGPVTSILLFMLFNVFFWLAFEQAGSSINKFTEAKCDRTIGFVMVEPKTGGGSKVPFEVPATWFQSVNAGLIFLLAPLFSALWTWLGRRHMNPSQPMKIALGLFFLGVGYLFTVWAGVQAAPDAAKASMWLIFATYFWHTVGELCLSPTGLSYVTKAAPKKYVSLLMGLWFISSFVANLAGGLIAAKVTEIEDGKITLPWSYGGRADFFFLFVVTSFGMAVVVFVLTPLLKKLMRSTTD